jgi:hypothetical protein
MNGIRIFGFLLLLAGVILQPIGWMYYTWAALVSFILIFAGVFLLFVSRESGAGDAGGVGGGPRVTGREMPTDVHGNSGQYSGGRSSALESNSAGDSGSSTD